MSYNLLLEKLLVLEWISCLLLTGLIWTIQLVHYPSFQYIDQNRFIDFEKFHTKTISYIVVPLMLLELFSGSIHVFYSENGAYQLFNYLMLILIWISTFLLSVPIHQKLNKGFSADLIEKLIITNWPRTILWTLRSFLLGSMLLKG